MTVLSEKLTFPGAHGAPLSALLDLPFGPVRATALFAHCFTCSKDIFAAERIAAALTGHGIAVLRFDFTGLGASGGDFANTNFSSNVADLLAAAEFMRGREQGPELLIGHSLGGAAVLVAAGDIPEVRAVATIGAPADAEHVIQNFVADLDRIEQEGAAEVTLAGRRFTIQRQFLEDLRTQRLQDRVATLGRPLMILHAPLDASVGIENAAAIFRAAQHPRTPVGNWRRAKRPDAYDSREGSRKSVRRRTTQSRPGPRRRSPRAEPIGATTDAGGLGRFSGYYRRGWLIWRASHPATLGR